MSFFIIECKVNSYNAMSGFYTVGFPSLTAFGGFVHNLELKCNLVLQKFNSSIKFESFAILSKEIQIRDGHSKHVKALKDSDKLNSPASIIDEKLADGYFSIIIQCDDSNVDDALSHDGQSITTIIENIVSTLKLSGGFLRILNVVEKNQLYSALQEFKYKNYFLLVDEYDAFDSLDDFFNKLIIQRDLVEQKNIYRPQYVPIVCGFQALTELTENKSGIVRRNNNYPHILAEPILTLCRHAHIASALNKTNYEEIERKILWKHTQKDNLLFLNTGE